MLVSELNEIKGETIPMNSVRFDPYVGQKYGRAGGMLGKKVLVLGASHYCQHFRQCAGCNSQCPTYGKYIYTEIASDGTGSGRSLFFGSKCERFTKVVVKRYMERIGNKGERNWFRTFSKFYNSFFMTRPVNVNQRNAILLEIAHTEYVRGAEGSCPDSRDDELFDSPANRQELERTVKSLSPDVIICWGARVWNKLCELAGGSNVCPDVRRMTIGGHELLVVRSCHPSSARFNRKQLQAALKSVGVKLQK